jgi:quercetin dioxygenase-like cupin family protein
MMRTTMAVFLLGALLAIPIAAEEPMQVQLATTIGEGPDQEVRKLHQGAWTQLMQITLRNGKTLTTHQAKEAVTIQCVSGEGTLVVDGSERIALTPGVVVLLEPNIPHAVESAPAVSVLVTRFLGTQ